MYSHWMLYKYFRFMGDVAPQVFCNLQYLFHVTPHVISFHSYSRNHSESPKTTKVIMNLRYLTVNFMRPYILCLFPVLNELFLRHFLAKNECLEIVEQVSQWTMWSQLVLILAVQPMDTVQEATKVMDLYRLNTRRLHGELVVHFVYLS